VKALVVHPKNPREFDFIIDTGDTNFEEEWRGRKILARINAKEFGQNML